MKEEKKLIHPSCQFDFSVKPITLDIRCTQCNGKYQSWTINCSKYNDLLAKYLENRNVKTL